MGAKGVEMGKGWWDNGVEGGRKERVLHTWEVCAWEGLMGGGRRMGRWK